MNKLIASIVACSMSVSLLLLSIIVIYTDSTEIVKAYDETKEVATTEKAEVTPVTEVEAVTATTPTAPETKKEPEPVPEPEPEPVAVTTQSQTDTSEAVSLGTFHLTAYCACADCCGTADGITATGTHATQGRTVAVDPDVIPLGSTVIINGHEFIAEDVGGLIEENKIDIYFDDHQEATNFGNKYAEVFVIY